MTKTFVRLFIIILILFSGLTGRAEELFFEHFPANEKDKKEKDNHRPLIPVRDTLRAEAHRILNSVTITALRSVNPSGNERYSAGTKLFTGSEKIVREMKMNSLADFLRREIPVYIKEYGNGSGAFISVRGTSSSQTRVSWNGHNLAMPTLGQTDLSHIPVFFFDRIEFHPGGGSTLYGDGSIGGSLSLNTRPLWREGFSADILLSAGSFGSVFTGANLRYSKKKTESRSSILYTTARNDYSFINNTKKGLPKEYLNNSAYRNRGLLQEVYRRFRDSSSLALKLLYMDFVREIQPSVSMNDAVSDYESIVDKNLKMNLTYSGKKKHLSYTGALSFSSDKEYYRDDIIATSTWSAFTEAEYRGRKHSLKGGAEAERIAPEVDSYSGKGDEDRVNLYLLGRYIPFGYLTITAGIRGIFVSGADLPLMPSLSARYILLHKEGKELAVRGSASNSCRIPTLNDRYWGGENLYLKSEKAFTIETGADYTLKRGIWSAELYGTFYKSRVRDWIRWLPAGTVWKPQNIPLVISTGVEAGGVIGIRKSGFSLQFTPGLTYTSIVTAQGLRNEDPSTGRQLAYQPRLSA
ncbi:MAG: TonB-dependent receptor, partial [Bacteroidales bacterium]|nr:TonB-dependent receptor [Bacteroidales bacterium]